MKETKRRMEAFSIYDHTGLEKHLEKMSARGWMLEKVGPFLWTYRKVEARPRTFSVTYFPQASAFDPAPSDSQQTFLEFCAEAGWTLAASAAQMQIFYSEEPDPIPIETDAVTQVETIHRAMKRNFLPAHLCLMLLAILQLAMFAWRVCSDPIDTLSDPFAVMPLLLWIIVAGLGLAEIVGYLRWHKRAARMAQEEGIIPPTHSARKIRYGVFLLLVVYMVLWLFSLGNGMGRAIGLLSLLYTGALLVAVNLLTKGMKKRQVSKKVNRIVTMTACVLLSWALLIAIGFAVFKMDFAGFFEDDATEQYEVKGNTFYRHNDFLPLGVEDLTGETYPDDVYSREADRQSFLLLSKLEVRQSPTLNHLGPPSLDYLLLQTKLSAVYDLCKNDLLTKYENWYTPYYYVSVDPSPWQAEEVYQRYFQSEPFEDYIVCWPGAILQFSSDWTPTKEQIAIIVDHLLPE